MRWVVLIAALPLLAYGVLNIVVPETTSRWQRASTARHAAGDARRSVGEGFENWLGDDPHAIRLLGVAEVVIALVIATAAAIS